MCKTFHITAAILCNKYQTLPICFVHFRISTVIMSLELFLMIFFGTLTCVIGILQLWMAFHQYIFWVRQLWNRIVVTLRNNDNSLLEAAMDQELSASIESFATCDTSFA